MTSTVVALTLSLLLLRAAVAQAAPLDPSAVYRGVTDQGKACGATSSAPCRITARTAADGTTVKRQKISRSADCGGDTRFVESTFFNGVEVPASGRVNVPFSAEA